MSKRYERAVVFRRADEAYERLLQAVEGGLEEGREPVISFLQKMIWGGEKTELAAVGPDIAADMEACLAAAGQLQRPLWRVSNALLARAVAVGSDYYVDTEPGEVVANSGGARGAMNHEGQ